MKDNYVNFDHPFYQEQNEFYNHFHQIGRDPWSPPTFEREKDPLEVGLCELRTELQKITQKLKDDEEAEKAENDWKFAAMVLDRLCLWLFALLSFFITMAIFGAAPHIIVY